MSIIVLILAVAVLVILEKRWYDNGGKLLRKEISCSKILVESGEPLQLTSRITNRSRLPVPFVRLHQEIPSEGTLTGAKKSGQIRRNSGSWWHVEERFALRPRQAAEKSVEFSLPSRGVYRVGRGRVTIGDLLGFREQEFPLEPQLVTVMPDRSRNQRSLDAAGGFLGDISVRRFILEDPILTVGFRDYTGREPMRAISWTRTATTGHLQVKQYDHTSEKTAVVLLNVRGASGELLEEAFRLTRSVCEDLERRKIPFSLRTNGNLPGPVGKLHSVPEGLGESHLNTILFGLGRADDTCFFSLRTLARQTMGNRKQSDAYILITPPLESEDRAVVKELGAITGNPVCILEVEQT